MAASKVSAKTATTAILDADMFYIVKAADNTKGYKITGTSLLEQIGSKGAWVPIQGSCAYINATSFTISGNYTTVLGIGDKLKLTNSTVKYFYVTAVSYSAPNTTVSVVGGSDYALANTTITGYYSHGTPVGFPDWINLTNPTWTTTGTAFTNQPTNIYQVFRICGRELNIKGYSQCNATSGGTGIFIATYTSGQFPTIVKNAVGTVVNTLDHWTGSTYMETGSPLAVKMHKYDGNALGGNYATMLFDITAVI